MRTDYQALFKRCKITPERRYDVEKIASRIHEKRARYTRTGDAVNTPWWCVGVIHSLESALDFGKHLHNGDPLITRTVHIPRGRPMADPEAGRGQPYTWEESAADALRGRWKPKAWALPDCFDFLEHYNGMGYWLRELNSPYIWGATDAYQGGYFIMDGGFSPTAHSKQVGAAAILEVLMERGAVTFNGV